MIEIHFHYHAPAAGEALPNPWEAGLRAMQLMFPLAAPAAHPTPVAEPVRRGWPFEPLGASVYGTRSSN